MKPVHIVLLVLAGAIGGAVMMKVAQRPLAPVARVQAPAQKPAAPPAPAAPAAPAVAQETAPVASAPEPEAKPSPLVEPSAGKAAPAEHPKRDRTAIKEASRPKYQPVAVARNTEPPQAATPAPPEQPLDVSTAQEASVSPARPEPENVTPPLESPPPPAPHTVTLNAGMLIPVRLVDGLSSERSMPGDSFTATLDRELVVDGFVIAERGARVEGRVVSSDRGGKVKGVAALSVELTRLRTSDGQNVAIQTDSFEKQAEPSHGQDVATVGAGAVLGAVVGAIAGGGKGAAVGAGVGGAAGAGGVLLTRGKPAALPSETRISFRLRAPVTLTERRG